jgi:lipopolysaccharide/colanic/teichoic acid biosynthesis glycosyltransferase
MSLERPTLDSARDEIPIRGDSATRRLVDVVVSAGALVLVSPLLILVVALVKAESLGPVFYLQKRIGKHGRPFRILKFRSMVANAERLGPLVSGRRGPRITRGGAFLRATKLDELPQLINVLRGDMTLIGPRADVARYVAQFTTEERQLLAVRPGLTGPSAVYFTTDQASELDGVTDPDAYYIEHQLHPKLALDLDYLRHRSVSVDIGILWRTASVLAGAKH